MESSKVDEIKRRVFEGAVPLRITISTSDVPLCFNAPRCMSLGTFIHTRMTYFLKESTRELWFSFEGRPLKWQLPIGVLYDALCPTDKFTPLRIEVKTENLPNDILRCESIDDTSSFFCHSFKESLFLTDGNSEILQMNVGIHKNMELQLSERNVDKYMELFTARLANVAHWKMYPLKFVTKELNIIQCFPEVNPEQTIGDVVVTKMPDFAEETVLIHGIRIPTSTKLCEIVDSLLYPDGFLYATV